MDIALKRQGLKRKDLAERLGISQPTLSKKFKYNDWRESDIKKICKIIDIECEIVLKFKDGSCI